MVAWVTVNLDFAWYVENNPGIHNLRYQELILDSSNKPTLPLESANRSYIRSLLQAELLSFSPLRCKSINLT